MEFLWDKDLKINTVHVTDVVAALWHLTKNGTVGEVYNLCDSNDTGKKNFANPKHLLIFFFKIKEMSINYWSQCLASRPALWAT